MKSISRVNWARWSWGRSLVVINDEQITFFKSVGNAAQDVAAAHVILARARELGLGTAIDLT